MLVWHLDGAGWGWWLVMSIGMVAFWALAIYGIVWLVRSGGSAVRSGTPGEPAASPRPVLERRLATGEIGPDEYEALRRIIDESHRDARAPEPAHRSTDEPAGGVLPSSRAPGRADPAERAAGQR